MMHVLILTDGYPNAYLQAQGIFVHDQAKALARHGIRVGVIACVPVSVGNLFRRGLGSLKVHAQQCDGIEEIVRCFAQIPKWYMYPVYRIHTLGLPLVSDYIEKHGKPDVIHVHGFHSGKLALAVKEKWQVPIVVTEHNSRFLAETLDGARLNFAKQFFQKADGRIAVSDFFRAQLERITECSFQVVPNAVDVALFSPGNRSEEFLFFSAARFDENKNQRLQIEAFARASKQMPSARLWLAGDGPHKHGCMRLVEELGLQNRVQFTGFLSRSKMIEAMQRSAVYLISSKRETFGVVAIEAMSCGMEVLSTPCGGPEETLPGRGQIAKPNPPQFAAAMQEIYDRRGNNRTRELHQDMVANYSYEAIAIRLRQVYSRLINSHS